MIIISHHAKTQSTIIAEQRTEQTSVLNALQEASIDSQPHGKILHVQAGAGAVYRVLRGVGITATIRDQTQTPPAEEE